VKYANVGNEKKAFNRSNELARENARAKQAAAPAAH